MEWVFDNIVKVISFVIFIVYILSSLKGKGEEEAELDPQAQERARRIQEEIRRKILERQRGEAPPVESYREEPEVIFEEPPAREASYREPVEPPPVPAAWVPDTPSDPFAEQKHLIEVQREKARKLRESIKHEKKHEGYMRKVHSSISTGQIRDGVREGLHNPKSLKTAIVLKEVLDSPIGLR